MKQFLVTLSAPILYDYNGAATRWDQTRIAANYMKIENGHLIFREEVRGSYPNTVRALAPGAWREVIELS
jgi:hypothetical protein